MIPRGPDIAHESTDSLLRPGHQIAEHGARVHRREQLEWGGHVRRSGRPALVGAAVAQVDEHPHVRFEQVGNRRSHDRNCTQRLQQRQMRVRDHVVVGRRRAYRVRQRNGRPDLRGCGIRVSAVHVIDARNRIEVGQEVDRVLRKVGEAVVFDRVDVRHEVIARSRAVEREPQTRYYEAGKLRQETAVGIHGIAEQREHHGQ